MMPTRENPFTPGSGLPPPLRAGHAEVVQELEARLRRICANGVGDMVVLYGPRGNGKTALLQELQEKAEEKGVTTRTLTSDTMTGGPAETARYIEFGDEEPEREIKGAGAKLPGFGADVALEEPAPPTIRTKLHTLLSDAPVLLTVDEAHVMPVDFGRSLLQTAQYLIGKRMRLLVVLAGTPGVRSNLGGMGASFWERSKKLRIGRLESAEDVRLAIAVPAEQAGLPVAEDALDLLVRESQGYPYFIQLLAAAAWDAAVSRRGSTRMELRDAQAGVTKAGTDKLEFYIDRFNEAERQGVLTAATAVSREMVARGNSPALSRHELMGTLEAATSGSQETALSAREKLSSLGFIWQNPSGDWEPGIPSLCAHFVEEDRKATGSGT